MHSGFLLVTGGLQAPGQVFICFGSFQSALTCLLLFANFPSVTDSRGTWIKPARFNTKTNRKPFSFQLKQKWTGAWKKAFFPAREPWRVG